MITAVKSIFVSVLCIVLASCSNGSSDALYEGLKDNEAKISLSIDGKPFYPDESIFKGPVIATDNFFRMNLVDQFESNVIIAISGDRWYTKHPIKRQVSIDNQAATSVMIGKLVDKAQRQGEGYLMAQGIIEVETISEQKLVLRVAGKVKRYGEPTKVLELSGFITYKKPIITVRNINKADAFY